MVINDYKESAVFVKVENYVKQTVKPHVHDQNVWHRISLEIGMTAENVSTALSRRPLPCLAMPCLHTSQSTVNNYPTRLPIMGTNGG